MIRRGGVTDVSGQVGNKVLNTSPRCNYGSVISELRVLASHTGNLGSVAQSALELEHWKLGSAIF